MSATTLPVRRAEGMEPRTGLLHGTAPVQQVEIVGLEFEIDVLHGQKTGFYLDQVENYRAVADWAKGRRVLDCFANQGAFSLACAKAGAAAVTAVEISAEAVAQIARERGAESGDAWRRWRRTYSIT